MPKEKIAANGEYNLSGERYREGAAEHGTYPHVELSEVTTKITDGAHFTPTYVETGVPFLRVTDITESNASKKFIPRKEHDELIKRCHPEKGDVLYSKNGTIGIAKLVDWDWEFSIFVSLCLIKLKKDILDPQYLSHFLNSNFAYAQATARSKSGTVTNLHLVDIKTIRLPLPPLEVQKEIVAEIEGYQKVINGARAVLDNYRPNIPIHPDWPMVELGDKLSFVSSGATPKGGRETYLDKGVLFIRSQNILCGSHDFSDAAFISAETHEEMSRSQVKYGDVFLNITGASIGRSAWMNLDIPANVNQHVAILRVGLELDRVFLSLFLNSDTGQNQILGLQAGGTREALNYSQIRQMKIPLPPLATQQAIVAEIEAEQALVDANRELINRFEQKIQATLARIWGEEAPAAPEACMAEKIGVGSI